MSLDPVPLCSVSEVGIHSMKTILDCVGALKDSAEEA